LSPANARNTGSVPTIVLLALITWCTFLVLPPATKPDAALSNVGKATVAPIIAEPFIKSLRFTYYKFI
jgi:hypothetical protein